MVRRALWTLLSLALCLGAISCRPAAREPRAFDYVIGVSMANLTEPWRISMQDEINAEAAHYANLRIVFTDAADSNTRQIQDVHTLLSCGIDLLIISPND
jgi:ABC-type sugar transport system substrate-binding protein